MKNHTDLLNYLATTFNLQSYLEIGVQYRRNNFDKIVCKRKIGVDPASEESGILRKTSDTFFYHFDYFEEQKFDLFFIDGLHHADQVKRDFENSLKCLTDNGFIVIHDTLPTDEKYTHVPRYSKIWFGDVYKFACSLPTYSGIDFCTIDFDYGCTVIWRANKKAKKVVPVNNWSEFQASKHLLNIVTVEQFKRKHEVAATI